MWGGKGLKCRRKREVYTRYAPSRHFGSWKYLMVVDLDTTEYMFVMYSRQVNISAYRKTSTNYTMSADDVTEYKKNQISDRPLARRHFGVKNSRLLHRCWFVFFAWKIIRLCILVRRVLPAWPRRTFYSFPKLMKSPSKGQRFVATDETGEDSPIPEMAFQKWKRRYVYTRYTCRHCPAFCTMSRRRAKRLRSLCSTDMICTCFTYIVVQHTRRYVVGRSYAALIL